ncbi:hypothetical protein EDD22DRAFT_959426 [Suillus occidentalis]|nr:hypothetical protein EDD22DRAFT_959426 [Suillus occidentalis]
MQTELSRITLNKTTSNIAIKTIQNIILQDTTVFLFELNGSIIYWSPPSSDLAEFKISKYYHPNFQLALENAAETSNLAPKRPRIPAPAKKHATRSAAKDQNVAEALQSPIRSPIRRCFSTKEMESDLHLESPITPICTMSSLAPQIKPITAIPGLELTDQSLILKPAVFPNHQSIPPPPLPTAPSSSNPIMSAISKGINAMPAPTSNKAPSFSGETSDLLDFFELFKDLAQACGLTDAEQCKLLVRYVDQATKRFWVTLSGYESKNFANLKASILEQYPGAKKGVRYTIRDLERTVLGSAEGEISTETELLQYYRQFRPIAHWLIANNKITPRERDRYFWQGLPATT